VASLNTAARELVLKIVYYGPGLGGKTTSLQALHDAAPAERRGKLVSLATPVDRTLYFDFLPLRLPPLRGLAVRLQLFTVPGQVYFNATRRLVLSGADGVVFVADSQSDRIDANMESLENLRENLAEHGRDLATLPHVFAYNKRDLPELISIEELDRQLNQHGAPSFGTIATSGEAVQLTLDTITKAVLDAYEAQLPEPAPSHRAIAVPAETPAVSVSRNGVEAEVYTSISDRPRAPADDDIETSSPPSSRVLVSDVSKIESAAAEEEKPPSSVESVAGTGWRQELERLEASPERATTSPGLSFSQLFAPGERALIEQIEQSIAHGDYSDALGMCDAAISRMLASVASLVAHDGTKASPHDPALPLLLGLDGRRYLSFRALARRARQIGDVGMRDALESYAFVLEARVAFGQWDALRSAVGANSVPPSPRPTPPPPSGMPPLPRGTLSPPRSEPT
jgi:signal recognition particle receptor subunit beta